MSRRPRSLHELRGSGLEPVPIREEMRRNLLEKLRKGDTTAVTVNAISNASGKYLSSIKLQLEIYKMLGRRPDVKGLLPDEATDTEADEGEASTIRPA